jgi:hypothetical protein
MKVRPTVVRADDVGMLEDVMQQRSGLDAWGSGRGTIAMAAFRHRTVRASTCTFVVKG